MKLLKAGEYIINLDNVTYIDISDAAPGVDDPTVGLWFNVATNDPGAGALLLAHMLVFEGQDARALRAYLLRRADDIEHDGEGC